MAVPRGASSCDASPAPQAMAGRGGWATFQALRDRSYRWLWTGSLASSATFQIGTLAQGWLVYELTGSAFAMGWVGSGWAVASLLLSPYGGALSDRMDKRDLLIWTRLAMALNALLIAVLISTGAVRLWHLALNSVLSGIFFSFMMPASQAIVSELVDQDTLLNAVSLNAVGMGLMGIVSATAAGYLVEVLGVDSAYYMMAGLYLMALYTLTRIPRTSPERGEGPPTSVWADLWEGVRYIGSHAVLPSLLGLTVAWTVLAMPYRTFMAKYAQDVMGMDASGLGLLMAAPGVGGLVSSLATASLGDFRGKGKLLLGAGLVLGLSLLLFANIPHLAAVLFLLGLVGAASNACMVANNCLLQVNSQERLLGRVMSVYMMSWGLMPLSTLPAGAIADRMGVPFVLSLLGGMAALVFLAVGLLSPRVRGLE
jgi:MFS family permease